MTRFWQYKVYADICGGSLDKGRLTTAIFSDFDGNIFENFTDKGNVIVWWYGLPRRLFTDPNSVTFNDLEWLFHAKFCFRAGTDV